MRANYAVPPKNQKEIGCPVLTERGCVRSTSRSCMKSPRPLDAFTLPCFAKRLRLVCDTAALREIAPQPGADGAAGHPCQIKSHPK